MLVFASAHGIDNFHTQMSKILHENVSLNCDICIEGVPAELWKSDSPWLRNPGVGLRFNEAHWERSSQVDVYNPMLDVNFQTLDGIDVGLIYSHSILLEETPGFGFGRFKRESHADSVGVYVAKHFNCGFRAGAAYSYTTDDFGSFPQSDTSGASATIGFARSFGEQRLGRNVFIDTSANFVYYTTVEAWDFLWLAKMGQSFSDRFGAYGVFNLYHSLERGGRPFAEAGGGLQAQIVRSVTFILEGTTPVIDRSKPDIAFQFRTALHWRF